MTTFESIIASLEEQHAAVNECKSLNSLQAARIWQTQIDGYSHVGELLRDGLEAEIAEHPSSTVGLELWDIGKQDEAKMHFEHAEIQVTAEYAYQIYLAVKAVIDQGENLK